MKFTSTKICILIESIILKNIATYNNVGVQINDLRKVNFIYGANGSGKTTISQVIYEAAKEEHSSCSINWKNNLPLKALVYNKNFKERNFGKGSLEGIFTLGQATKEDIEAIELLNVKLDEIKNDGIAAKKSLEKLTTERTELEEEFREEIWLNLYKEYENDFKEVFRGYMKKDSFHRKVLFENKTNESDLHALTELKGKVDTILNKTPVALDIITEVDFTRIRFIESDKVWIKKVVGSADVEIAKLIQRLNINDWVSEGRAFIENTICPFCQKETITEDFMSQIELFFDETYLHDTTLVKKLSDEYVQQCEYLNNLLVTIEQKEKINPTSKLAIDKYSASIQAFQGQLSANRELLKNKIKEPSRTITLTNTEQLQNDINNCIKDANDVIKKHNALVENYTTEKDKLIKSVWKFIVNEYIIEIDKYAKKIESFDKGIALLTTRIAELQKEYRAKRQEIVNANQNVTSVQPTIDQINKLLESFGFANFKIVSATSNPNQYQILREDGRLAETTLSEGEITFITFLYYLQLCKGSTDKESITDERILVIDDPISSLDSNILFIVSSLIKQLIKTIKGNHTNIKQIILLTHNVYFHKEVSFVDGRTKVNNDTYYWILRRNGLFTTIQCYEKANPIQNSYELLWRELKNETNTGLSIQNTMRRIIENYFKILGKMGDDAIIDKFEDAQEREVCRSLICWINDGSHSIPDDVFVEFHESITSKYFEVFEKIFDKMGHLEHYNMMMPAMPEKEVVV